MQNEIMTAVTRRLFELFGDGYAIYTDNVEQELRAPCFFVTFLEPSERPLLGRRYLRTYDMSIQYFPGEENPTRECNQITDRLMDGMEYIALEDGSPRRGRDKSAKLSEDVLTFLVTYDVFGVKAGTEAEPMETLKMRGETG